MRNLLRVLLSTAFLALLASPSIAQVVGGAGGGGGTVTQGAPNSAANAWPFFATVGGSAISATNGLYSNLLQGNAVLSATNGLYSNMLQGNAVLSATNGLYSNLLQGNAALSITNPIFAATFIQPLTNAQGGNLTPVVSGALEASHVFKSGAGNLYSAYATSTSSGVAGFFVCVNATSISAGAITPIDFVAMPAGPTTVGFNYSPGPPGAYSTGITCAETVATTPFTYTAPSSVLAYHGLVD
jgi:hypothetical protein